MDAREKIKLLKSFDPAKGKVYPEDIQALLEKIGDAPKDYYSKLVKGASGQANLTKSIEAVGNADYETACATLLAMARAAHFGGEATFFEQMKDGSAQKVIDRMIDLLQSNGSEAADARARMIAEGR